MLPDARDSTGGQSGFTAEVRAGETLHLWLKPAEPAAASRVHLRDAGGRELALAGPASDDFQMREHPVSATGTLAVGWNPADTSVSLCYAFDPARVLEDGIRPLRTTAPDTPRFRLHLAPAFGWMNDPNGLSTVGGRTHAFYQNYPHARRWDTMHWGHAASLDLVDWTHLPVFLHPRPEMLADPARKGGAYSGSAIPRAEGGLRIFYTDREDGRPEQEWQMTAVSADLLAVGPSSTVVDRRPPLPGYGNDFRDPYVFMGPDGLWKMLLGGNDAGAALVPLYETTDPEAAGGWRFVGPLHREPLPRSIPAECPCLVPLDGDGQGLFALVFGLIGHRRLVRGRLNPSLVLVGRFDGRRFEEIARRELDFAGDCYAFQGFVRDGRPVGIAWAANWAEVRPGQDFPSAMTFVRRLVWRDGALLTPPVEAVEALRTAPLADSRASLVQGVLLPDGLAEVAFTAGGPFRLALDHPDHPMTLVHDGETLELVAEWARFRGQRLRLMVDTGPVRDIRVFVDVGLVEVYADGGRWCGTKRIDSDRPITAVRLEADPETITDATVWQLRPQGRAR
ncbi:MAG: GH32 C-terminal domain-containing protein [Amaricoccus sp.]